MTLEIYRHTYNSDYTVGDMYIRETEESGLKWLCNTLEPTWRDLSKEPKVNGHTAIPAGKYLCSYDFSWKFHRKLPRLYNVPNFDGILIHAGNTSKDTKGCILVGIEMSPGYVANSKFTLERICMLLLNHGGSCIVRVFDGARKPTRVKGS